MKTFDLDGAEITLIGDLGNRIGWQQTSQFWVWIESEWYQARVEVEIDRPQLEAFYSQLQRFSQLKITTVDFSASGGLYEMTLKRGDRGNVTVSGSLSQSMVDGSRLDYTFETNLPEVDNFYRAIGKMLSDWES